ncbi:MAG: diguanylate cyclase [Dehalococcoidia bacterium]|nr:diguanylate cyclase [Dehalococcoidia bacterium]
MTEVERAFSLGAKLLAPFMLIMLLVVGGVVWVEYGLQRDQINDGYVRQGEILARALATSLETEQENGTGHLGDTADLNAHIQEVLSLDPAVLRANIYVRSGDGAVRAGSSDLSLVGLEADFEDAQPLYTGATNTVETRLGDEKALEVLAPVQVDGETIASLGLYLSLKERDAALQALALRLTAGPALALLLSAGTIWLALRILVLRRLSSMIRAGEGLAQGNMASRVPGRWDKPGRDEMAIAVHHFNNMAESVQSLTAKLERLGVTDALTGIYNRRFLDEMLPREVSRSQRSGAPLALLMVDIDRFKRFNDRHGHQAGDEALRGVAHTLAQHLRSMDFVARYGGEEFAVALPGADRKSALATAERLRLAVESAAISPAGESERLTVSIGAAACPSDANDAASLVAAADAALYAAKEAGRNTVRAAQAVDAAAVAG